MTENEDRDSTFRRAILTGLRQQSASQVKYEKIVNEYAQLLGQVVALQTQNEKLRTHTNSAGDGSTSDGDVAKLKFELSEVYRLKGLNDQKLIDCNQKLQQKETECSELRIKYGKALEQIEALKTSNKDHVERSTKIEKSNGLIRDEYLALQATYNGLESKHKKLEVEYNELVQRWVEMKNQQVDEVNMINEQLNRKRDSDFASALQSAIQQEVVVPTSDNQLLRKGSSSFTTPSDVVPDKCVHKFQAHQAEVNTLAWTPNTHQLATGSVDRKIHIWKINPLGGKQDKMMTLTGCNQSVMCIDFDANERMLLAASNDMNVRLWTLNDQRLRDVMTGHTSKVGVARFHSQASEIVSGSNDRTIKLWDVRNRRCVKNYFPGSIVTDLVCSDLMSGSIISGHFDKKLRFWDTRNDTATSEMELGGRITSLQLSYDTQYVLVSTRDDSLVLIDLRMNQRIHTYCGESFHVGSDLSRATLSAGGEYCAAGTNDGKLFVWNVKSTQIEKTIQDKNPCDIMAVSWHPMGWHVAGSDRQGFVHLWSS